MITKKLSSIILSSCLLYLGCTNREDYNKLQEANDSLRSEILNIAISHHDQRNSMIKKLGDTRIGIWDISYSKNKLNLIFSEELPDATLNDLAERINNAIKPSYNPGIKIQSASNGIAYVKIINSRRLTEGMGTTGAVEYLARVTFTLTSIPNIKFVNYDFQRGSHANPGIRSRFSFIEYCY